MERARPRRCTRDDRARPIPEQRQHMIACLFPSRTFVGRMSSIPVDGYPTPFLCDTSDTSNMNATMEVWSVV